MDYESFFADLKQNKVHNCYLFEGEEEYTKESALKALQDRLISGPFGVMNLSVLNDPGYSDLVALVETLPLMQEKRLIIVKECSLLVGKEKGGEEESGKKETADGERFAAYVQKLPETSILVFYVRGKARANRKLYKRIDALGTVIHFDPLSPQTLQRWIVKEFRLASQTIDAGVLNHLIFTCGQELSKLKTEIAKISAYAFPNTAISIQDIEAVATKTTEYRVFDLSEKVVMGESAQAINLLHEMIASGEERLMLLSLLARQYRQMLFTALLDKAGKSKDVISKTLAVPPFAVGKNLKLAQSFSLADLRQFYALCIQTEYDIKSGKISEEGSLESLILRIFARAKRKSK